MLVSKGLQDLRDGNQRFLSGQFKYPHHDKTRLAEVVEEQQPFALILSCSDSRVPPEVIFDQGLGDIVVVRTAGNVVDDIVLGSIEYAVEHLNVQLVLVLGHQKCGAVSAAVEGGEVEGHIADVVKEIQPLVEKAKTMPGDALVNVIDLNITSIVERLKTTEPILSEYVKVGKLEIVGARYDLESGRVSLV